MDKSNRSLFESPGRATDKKKGRPLGPPAIRPRPEDLVVARFRPQPDGSRLVQPLFLGNTFYLSRNLLISFERSSLVAKRRVSGARVVQCGFLGCAARGFGLCPLVVEQRRLPAAIQRVRQWPPAFADTGKIGRDGLAAD